MSPLRVFVRTGMSLCAAGGFALAQPRVASAGPQDSRVDAAGVAMMVAQAPDRPVKDFRVPAKVPAIVAPPPVLTRVEPVPGGYAVVGSGFGADRAKVQVFEGNTQVPDAAVVSVTDDRIVARSHTTGPVDHKVVVAGRASNMVSFTHTGPPAALRSRRALDLSRFQSRTVTTGELTMTGPRFLERKAITTGELTMTGPRFLAHVGVTTGQLTMTGPRFLERKAITTGELTMTGPRFLAHVGVTTGELTMTGPRFLERKAITTGELTMTGPRFLAHVGVTTGQLTMTGPRFLERKAITTGELLMTGPRFLVHVGVTTGELTMTGPRFLERKAITTGGLSMTGPR